MRLKPSPYLRESFVDELGDEVKVAVRNYQAVGIMDLLQVPRTVLSDDTGLGKTLQTLCMVGYVWTLEPEYVPIVVTRKSSLYQWDDEVKKFMQNMSAVVVDGEPYERDVAYEGFFSEWTPASKKLLIMTYDTLLKDFEQTVVRDRGQKPPKGANAALKKVKDILKERKAAFEPTKGEFKLRFDGRNDIVKTYLVERLKPADKDASPPAAPSGWDAGDEELMARVAAHRSRISDAQLAVDRAREVVEPARVAEGLKRRLDAFVADHPAARLMLVMDEAHVVKNSSSKIHKALYEVQKSCERVVAMTATPVKNRLMEFFAIFRITCPFLFPKVTHFMNEFCIVKMQKIGGGRQVPIVVGHSKAQIEAFVEKIEPYYLSRRKHEVAKELPELITREVLCVLSKEQQDLYEAAEIEAEIAKAEADPDEPDVSAMRCMTLIQQASNAPQLLENEDGVPYEGESSKLEALVEILQNSPDAKVIVFSRFKKMINLIEARLKKEKIASLRITGDEDAKERRANREVYQSPESGVNVMLITTAGTESLNLQATEYIVCVDSPWSWGDYVQLIGRSIRIGSKNLAVYVIHLVAVLAGGRETIDHHVVKTLRDKRKLADAVSGEALQGGLEFAEEDMAREVAEIIRKSRESGTQAGVRDAVRTRIQSSGSAKKKGKRAKAAEDHGLFSLEGPSDEAPAKAAARPPEPKHDLGLYVDMTDL